MSDNNYLDSQTLEQIPSIAKSKLMECTPEQQAQFMEEFNRRKKSVGLAYFFLIVCLCMPYGYLGKWGMQLVYWFTGGGFFVWFIYLLFTLPNLVKDYNKSIAMEIVRDIAVMSK